MSTMWNGILSVVHAGTVVLDPEGKRAAITIDDQNVAVVGRMLYCTASTEAKIVARIEAINKARSEVVEW
ncbi:hypothetical protein [Mesorhizobium sp.]|uniref:hypothetical protein n=1 Tax=Mesorhizobium sp. TaxID=1871066 RepID=UPI00120B540D|nr:hypothetical protein [Mesorhizobium sp.]TIS37535.1 MAG: hypothetical protein E5W95_18150 [Mesorhizobium sp.]